MIPSVPQGELMRTDEREVLRARFQFRCGYCGVNERDVPAELTVDHFQPRSRGGPDEPANWVYACFTCNNLKRDLWAPDSTYRILHPLDEDLSEHFSEQPDGSLTGLTMTGGFHIQQLQLNHPSLIAHRRERNRQENLTHALEEALRHQEELRQRVEALEQAVANAQRRLRPS
jgi:hypothetical protein